MHGLAHLKGTGRFNFTLGVMKV